MHLVKTVAPYVKWNQILALLHEKESRGGFDRRHHSLQTNALSTKSVEILKKRAKSLASFQALRHYHKQYTGTKQRTEDCAHCIGMRVVSVPH